MVGPKPPKLSWKVHTDMATVITFCRRFISIRGELTKLREKKVENILAAVGDSPELEYYLKEMRLAVEKVLQARHPREGHSSRFA